MKLDLDRTAAGFICLILCASSLPSVWAGRAHAQTLHASGQDISPVCDGYELNPDGSFTLWFGYFNRNTEETLDLPLGSANRFEPGPADRGQPTHFLPLRQRGIFSVTVPKDFGEQTLTWTLTVRGRTGTAIAQLKKLPVIDRRQGSFGGPNRPPAIAVTPSSRQIPLDKPAIFTVVGTDDGLPQRLGAVAGMTLSWAKYRGAASGRLIAPPPAKLGTEPVTSSLLFSEPGEYTIQALVEDGSGRPSGVTACCWATANVSVTVTSTRESGRGR